MNFDPVRSARVDIKRRRQRNEAKIIKRNLRSWEEDADIEREVEVAHQLRRNKSLKSKED